MRKAFNFYLSFYEMMKFLSPNQVSDFLIAICKVQFLEIHVDEVDFEDEKIQLVWTACKHSIKASVEGCCSKMNLDYDAALSKGLPEGVNDKDKEKEKGKDKCNMEEKGKDISLSPLIQSEVDEMSIRIASHLLNKILINKPNFKKPETGNWEIDIKKAISVDKRTEKELIGCINWIYSSEGTFWIPNIMSGKKLREKFDTMEAQMINSPKNISRNKTAQILAKVGY